MAWIDLLQWPAMATSVVAAWLMGSQRPRPRAWSFAIFLVGNALWAVWGWHDRAWALVALQVCLAAVNLRGARRNERAVRSG